MSGSISAIDPLSIPLEIWSLVFGSYLPLEDRKNVRLTCRRFYEACCTCQIQRNEEIVFEGNLNTHSALQSLCDTERKVWNIKLCGVQLLDDLVLPFFEKHGAYVHSLILVDCHLNCENLINVLDHCGNLLCFSLIFTGKLDLCIFLFTKWEALEKKATSSATVTDLTLELTSYQRNIWTNKKLSQFFAIFPNIKKLEVTIVGDFHESSSLSSDATSEIVFSPSCIYHLLMRIGHQLEELSLHLLSAKSRAVRSACETLSKIAAIEMKNLRQLSSYGIISDITEPHFQHLTSLNCVVLHDLNMPISAQILLILKSASRLHSLTVRVWTRPFIFQMCKECFVTLVRSQLKTLNIWDWHDNFFDPSTIQHGRSSNRRYTEAVRADFVSSSLDDSLMPNYILQHLNLQTDDTTLMFSFSKYFLRLQNLYVRIAQEDILCNIFNYQTKLRNLALYHCERHPVFRISAGDNPFEDRLRNLEISPLSQIVNLTQLYIGDNISLDLSRFMLSEFVFSKLKSLTIEMLDARPKMNCDIEALWRTIQKSTRLEYLTISWRTEATFQQWLNLFESLPKLRHFSCTDSCSPLFADSEYRQLFHSRSSLRLVYHCSNKTFECIRCVYDVITNTVQLHKSIDQSQLMSQLWRSPRWWY